VTVGGLDFPRETEVHRRQHQEAFDRVPEVYAEAQAEFEKVFGRKIPDRVVPYQMDDAEIAIVCIGTFASTVKPVVDKLRKQGIKAGLVRLRMLRPFPEQEMVEILSGVERIGVMDRDISLGMGGVLWSETRGCAPHAIMQNYMIGLGGGDVRAGHIETIFTELLEQKESGKPRIVEVG
jgi:pyruvate/2-oxoacid:ferredoxin oxidoreductase alpha subunit